MTTDEIYMHRCVDLALLGNGFVAPNPMVGCVIVCDGRIIGEGFHRCWGEGHAEVNAINSVKDERLLQNSTLYVSLEPCAHYGKTPPCALLIVEKRIPRVVVGTIDPFAKVSGKGIKILREAGVDVTVGVLNEECEKLNCRFFTFHKRKRPYVILKWAQTIDGFIDISRRSEKFGHPTWITNYLSRIAVHRQRTEAAAVMIGTNTAEKDNPFLTVREWSGKSPIRVVMDRGLRLSNSLHVFDGSVPTLVFTDRYLSGKNNLEYIHIDYEQNVVPQILTELYQRDIQSLVVEGGRELLESFIVEDYWDEAWIYVGNRFFGEGVEAPLLSLPFWEEDSFDQSQVYFFNNQLKK